MLIPPLSRRGNAFLERNLFLHAVLGLREFGQRFSAYIEYAVQDTRASSPETTPGFERDVLLVVGLVNLWRRCEQQLDVWSHADASSALQAVVAKPKRALPGLGAFFR